jgi:hypothetical protein
VVSSVFELPSLRNTQKRNKTKKIGKTDIKKNVDCLEKRIQHDFLPKYFHGVFELTSPSNAQKTYLKKISRQVGGWVWDLADVRGGPSNSFWRPLVLGVSVAMFMAAYVRRTNPFCVLLPAQASLSALWPAFPCLRFACTAQHQHQHQGGTKCQSCS